MVIAVDYFIKWAKAELVATITGKKMEDFVERNIISRFGISRVLISDNGRQFDTPTFRSFCSNYGISNHYSSPKHPQAKGQAKVSNRTILHSMEAAKGLWVEELPILMWAYQTTSRVLTGETPFSLTIGFEAVVPIELGLPSFKTNNF